MIEIDLTHSFFDRFEFQRYISSYFYELSNSRLSLPDVEKIHD